MTTVNREYKNRVFKYLFGNLTIRTGLGCK